ncbi:MAG: tRNA uridine-5-carboxymethylaminomethyl(34) synthesis GTPase MnmE [Gammaproteobacteria bacterium]|nr:tRNA uridine-5-carboxymethylaminomethyl(34) synthesis GTPase MnmE [Gammaproteobacteria bacterium]
MNTSGDTIAAVATAPGYGGIGILRLSGPNAAGIANAVCGALPAPRQASLRTFRDSAGQALDQGLVLFFPAPASFTGEDVVELHGHGGPVVLDQLLCCCLERGARAARAGEFSERAFLNGRLDLAQAEAIADLIESGSAMAARGAMRSLSGEFSRQVTAIVEALIGLRTRIEAAIDFPEEEIDFLADGELSRQLALLDRDLDELRKRADQGALLRHGLEVALAGPPNAGKSSLLNALSGEDTAIVHHTPGTTRDLLRCDVQIEGLPVHLVDTAGLRESGDAVEREGVRRARRALAGADLVLWVCDDSAGPQPLPPGEDGTPRLQVFNKIDLSGRAAGEAGPGALALSARTGAGLAHLRSALLAAAGYRPAGEGTFTARRRHLDAMARAARCLHAAAPLLAARDGELAAEELRGAQHALAEITGAFGSEELLGQIFASFCIGK